MNELLKKTFLKAATCVAFLTLFSCTRNHLIYSWDHPTADLTRYKKVLVIGLMGEQDNALRQDMELDMALALNAHKMHTSSAFEKFGAHSFTEKNEILALQDIKDSSYDAAVCIVLVDAKKEKRYTPAIVNSNNSFPNNNNFNGAYFDTYNGYQNYYRQSYSRVYTKGYYHTTSEYTMEVIVFDLPKDSVQYYAETKSYNPRSFDSMSEAISEAVTKDMVKKKLLPPIKK